MTRSLEVCVSQGWVLNVWPQSLVVLAHPNPAYSRVGLVFVISGASRTQSRLGCGLSSLSNLWHCFCFHCKFQVES